MYSRGGAPQVHNAPSPDPPFPSAHQPAAVNYNYIWAKKVDCNTQTIKEHGKVGELGLNNARDG